MNRKTIPCAAFILFKDNKILVEKRKLDKHISPGKIAIPGGRILENELKEDAMIREAKEELDVSVKDYSYVGTLLHTYTDVDFQVEYFLVKSWDGKIKTLEASKLLWIAAKNYEKIDVSWDRLMIQTLRKNKLL